MRLRLFRARGDQVFLAPFDNGGELVFHATLDSPSVPKDNLAAGAVPAATRFSGLVV
jgi:hypothetical protein